MFLVALLPAPAPGQLGDLIKQVQKNTPPKSGAKAGNEQVAPVVVQLAPYTGPKKRLAVSDMEIKIQAGGGYDSGYSGSSSNSIYISPPSDFGQGLTDMLVTGLVATNRFIVIERSDRGIQDIQREQQQSGVDERTRAQSNRLLGAQVLVRGAVTEYSYSKSSQGGGADILKGIGVASAKSEASVVIDVKLYDATTGEIYDSQKAEGRAKSSGTTVNIDRRDLKFGGSSFQNSPLGAATRSAIEQAIRKICSRMDVLPWEGRLADVVTDEGRGTEIYLNVGAAAGIKVGDEFEVYRPGRIIEDPDNPGRILRQTKGARIGTCKVVSVEKDISVARPVTGEGFAAKDVIRVPGALAALEQSKPAGEPAKPDQDQKTGP